MNKIWGKNEISCKSGDLFLTRRSERREKNHIEVKMEKPLQKGY
jgi:hypothetical protein